MTFPLFEDDLAEGGLIRGRDMHRRGADLPAVAVLCFFHEVLDRLAASGELVERYRLRSEFGVNPVYVMDVGGRAVTVTHPGVGAPLAVGFTEELVGLGVTTLVACGGAGALVERELGHVMVVDSALRDEGTSFHYAAPSRVIDADPLGVRLATETLERLGVAYEVGRTWTTDALFRETPSRIARRVAEGCAMVDMESSAFIAATRYLRVRFAQLLYAGDSLTGESWDPRRWVHAGDVREGLLRAAARVALALSDAPGDGPARVGDG